jgi:hypothetical protein
MPSATKSHRNGTLTPKMKDKIPRLRAAEGKWRFSDS